MSLTKIGSIGINTGIQLAGVTTVSTLKVGSGVTLSSDGHIFSTGITTVGGGFQLSGGDIKVGSGTTLSPDGNIFATGVTTSTTFVGALTGNVTGNVTGTLQTAAQANITSLGTLTGLTINGDATFTGSSANIVFDQSTDDIVFNDNAKAVFGTGLDLEIFHDGSNSYIKDTGTGSLLVRGSTISLQSASGEAMIEGVADGAVTIKHDNSTKFETSSTGVSITGNATISGAINTSDNQNINVGNGGDLKIFHDGTDSFIHGTTSTRQLKIRGQEIRCVNEANSEIMAKFIEDGAVELYHNGVKKLHTFDSGVVVSGDVQFYDGNELQMGSSSDFHIGHDGSTNIIDGLYHPIELRHGSEVHIKCNDDGAVELYNDNSKKFETSSTGVKVISEESRIVMFDESNGVNERKVIYRGLGNTATGTFTASNCHGGGTVTVVSMNNGNGNISTTRMFPIHINSNGTATLGSEIFTIHGSVSGSSFSTAAAAQGITVTNGGGAFCQFRVTFDITANVS